MFEKLVKNYILIKFHILFNVILSMAIRTWSNFHL